MKNRYSFTLSAQSVEWYQYHYSDSLFRNDVAWRTWRILLQTRLTPTQLAAQACAICHVAASEQRLFCHEYLGGYHLIYCASSCYTPTEQGIQRILSTM